MNTKLLAALYIVANAAALIPRGRNGLGRTNEQRKHCKRRPVARQRAAS